MRSHALWLLHAWPLWFPHACTGRTLHGLILAALAEIAHTAPALRRLKMRLAGGCRLQTYMRACAPNRWLIVRGGCGKGDFGERSEYEPLSYPPRAIPHHDCAP